MTQRFNRDICKINGIEDSVEECLSLTIKHMKGFGEWLNTSTYVRLGSGDYWDHQDAEVTKTLDDRYMKCSKCDPPGEHFLELLAGNTSRDTSTIGKGVYLSVYETNKYGHAEWQLKHKLTIHPFKKEHWWADGKTEFVFEECEFRYSIVKD